MTGRRTASNLGAGAYLRDGRTPRRLTNAEVEQMAVAARHGACVKHVPVGSMKVCIRRGDDEARVVADALELQGGG